MRASSMVVLLLAAAAVPLAGCQTNEQSFGAGGAAVGALACGVAGAAIFGTTAGGLGSAAACGAAGYFVGSAIGRKMDERDRARAEAATQQALLVPVSVPPNKTVVQPKARPVKWASDHGTGNTGSANLVSVQRQPSGGECRTVREVAYIKGQEETQESKYCRGPEGDWKAA